jgi:hypothetical protein
MKKLTLIYIAGSLLLVTGLGSCTKGLEGKNYDPTKPVTAPVESLLTGAERAASNVLYNNYVNGKIGMLYAQYWSQTQKESDSQYLLDEGCNNTLWSVYSSALSNLDEIVRLNGINPEAGSPNQVAIANVLSVWIYHVLTDTYGNIPYSEALGGLKDFTPAYDDARTVYDSLLKQLDAQLALFDSSKSTFRTGELVYNGKVSNWKKLANSLKLRIGLRMAEQEEANAKQVIEAAVSGGVFESAADEAAFPYQAVAPDQFPFNEQSGGGLPNDYQVSETLVKYMQGVADPRLPVYARPATLDNTIKGKPYGIGKFDGGYGYNAFSYPGTKPYSPTFPGIIMSYAEVEFALAEAAARNFNVPGTAAAHYEKGIRASMAFWGVQAGVDDYLAKVPYNAADWRNCIGTQKWLALYMQGMQSWFERLRLKFGKPGGESLFAAPAGGSLDANVTLVPNRLTYPASEANINRVNYQAAGQAIGGDNKGTKLWWNK